MQKLRHFLLSFSSLFAFLMSFQLEWAKRREIYTDIFLRFCVIFLATAPLLYISMHLIHFLRTRSKKSDSDIRISARLLFPLSVFHLQWFQYVSDHKWPYTNIIIYCLFTIAVLVMILIQSGKNVVRSDLTKRNTGFKNSINQVNSYFLNCLKQTASGIFHVFSNPVKFWGLTFYPETWLLLTMEAIIIIKYCVFSIPQPFLFPVNIALTLLLPVLLVHTVRNLTFLFPAAGTVISAIVVFLYFLLTFFYITEDAPFDYSLLLLNSDLMTHKQTFVLLSEKFRIQSWLFILFCTFAAVKLFLLRSSKNILITKSPIRNGLISGFVYVVLFIIPINNMDQLKSLLKSINDYRNQEKVLETASTSLKEPFPYYHPAENTPDSSGIKPLPNIILVCLESCNGLLIESKTEQGKLITPVLDSLIPFGTYIEHFYGNSIQTARGFFTIMTGIPAGFRGKEAKSMPDLRFRGLPAILSDYGYSTCFIKAYHDLLYDNTDVFMKAAGFKTVLSMTEDRLTEYEKAMRWGWGLQDDIFYKKTFSILDSLHNKQIAENNEHPFFLTTFNVSNHMMFQDIPDSQKYLYPNTGKGNYYENYRNSMFLSDSCLRELFVQLNKREWLNNSIIILVGDHSFPSGIHSQKNEKGAWEDNFRTPFLLIWKDHLTPSRLSQFAYSQIDLMPTIFDLLKIKPAHHSLGKSIFTEGPRNPVMLSQPYDGIYLVSIQYPYKLVKRLRGNSLQLFNIQTDPMERQNMIQDNSLQPITLKLQESITRIIINQQLIELNRLWPPVDPP